VSCCPAQALTDLRAGPPHASPSVLAQRLRQLERAGVVRRRRLPPPAASRVYELIEWGLELEPVVVSPGRWWARSPLRPRDAGLLGVDSLILSLRTMFYAGAAEGLEASYEQRLGEDDRFQAEVTTGGSRLGVGAPTAPTLSSRRTPRRCPRWSTGRGLEEVLRPGELRIEGDESAVERFLNLFPLPEPAERPPPGYNFTRRSSAFMRLSPRPL
jgi:hypothetical protein